ncbi:MAG: hypothetical protein ABIA66_03845 [Candidatus Omnitrophota bacterium]
MLARSIGILITTMGLIVIVSPKLMKCMLAYWRQGKRVYLGGLLRIFFGVIFLLSASYARLPQAMSVLGVFTILAGVLLFVLGSERAKEDDRLVG